MIVRRRKYSFTVLLLAFVLVVPVRAATSHMALYFSLQQLSIDGHTNVNTFWLKYARHNVPLSSSDFSTQQESLFAVSIPVNEFVFSNHLMKHDFLSMIHATQYPDIRIQLKDLQKIASFQKDSTDVVNVDITLAGIKRSVSVVCNIDKGDESHFDVTGTKAMKLSDFELVPPAKFFGLVKVNDDIVIHFEIRLILHNN